MANSEADGFNSQDLQTEPASFGQIPALVKPHRLVKKMFRGWLFRMHHINSMQQYQKHYTFNAKTYNSATIRAFLTDTVRI